MSERLAIGAVAALALAGVVRRRGSPNADTGTKFKYWAACPDFHSGEIIDYINDPDRAVEITYKTFAKHVDLAPLREQDHPAMWRISSPDNWAVSFYRSSLPNGDRIYFFDWSRIEHIFVDPAKPQPSTREMAELAIEQQRGGSSNAATGASLSTSLDLPTLPRSPGPGFYRKGRSVVVIGAPMGRDHGNDPPVKLQSWRGTARPESFTSPMVRWDNMHFMGGYSWRPHHWDGATYDGYRTDEAIVDAVIAGKKPAAEVGRIGGGYGADPQADMRKAKELHAKAKAAGLYVSPLETTRLKLGRWLRFAIAHPGTVGDHFDLDAWVDTWDQYGWNLVGMARWAKDKKLSDLINSFVADEYSIPPPITGLLLGFPIFSTVAVWK